MQNDLISRSVLIACVINKPSKVCQDAPYDHAWFTRLVDREQEILDMINNAPAVDAVEREKLIKKLFPMGVPMTREDWNYAINARAVYEAIMKMEE